MVNANGGLPVLAQPEVFHKDGRRLFIIDGEPRVADEDLAKDLQMARKRSIRWNLIDANRDGLMMLGSIFQIDPQARQLLRHDPDGVVQPPFDKAVAEKLLDLLKIEGLIDPSKRGEKPKINFLNAEQAKFLIVTSGMPKGRDLLVDLIKLEKAWRDGTLQPAGPAVPLPPVAPAALPPPAPPQRVTGISHDGVVYELEGGVLHVIDESLYRTAGYDPRRMRALFSDLSGVGPVPDSASVEGALLLSLRHVELVVGVMRRDFGSPPGVGVNSIVATLRDHGAGHLQVVAGTIIDPVGPDGVSRQYAAAGPAGRRCWPGRRSRSCVATIAGCGSASACWRRRSGCSNARSPRRCASTAPVCRARSSSVSRSSTASTCRLLPRRGAGQGPWRPSRLGRLWRRRSALRRSGRARGRQPPQADGGACGAGGPRERRPVESDGRPDAGRSEGEGPGSVVSSGRPSPSVARDRRDRRPRRSGGRLLAAPRARLVGKVIASPWGDALEAKALGSVR